MMRFKHMAAGVGHGGQGYKKRGSSVGVGDGGRAIKLI